MTILRRLWRTLFSWSFQSPPEEDLKSARLIVTQSYSRNADGTPGPGNEIIAAVVSSYHRLGQPVFAQEEVAECLPQWIPQAGIAGGSPDGKSKAGWNTYVVARLQVDYCLHHGIKTVIVVAHPLHMNRALWVYECLGVRALPACMPLDYASYQGSHLVHRSCRHHWFYFWLREMFVARPIFFLQGKI